MIRLSLYATRYTTSSNVPRQPIRRWKPIVGNVARLEGWGGEGRGRGGGEEKRSPRFLLFARVNAKITSTCCYERKIRCVSIDNAWLVVRAKKFLSTAEIRNGRENSRKSRETMISIAIAKSDERKIYNERGEGKKSYDLR